MDQTWEIILTTLIMAPKAIEPHNSVGFYVLLKEIDNAYLLLLLRIVKRA